MSRKISYKILSLFILSGVAFLLHAASAQDFGITAVNEGLGGSLANTDPRVLAGRIINIALGFLGVIAVGIVTYAGFLWMSSGGEEEKITTAKRLLRNGIIGLAIILASWGITVFIISQLSGAVSGTGTLNCTPGSSLPCGCFSSGVMVCQSNGNWGSCVGQNCGTGVGGDPTSCDGGIQPGCQASPQICAPSDYCNATSCSCVPKAGQGESCDLDPNTATCEVNNNQCGEYLTCNPLKGCTCDGPPVITGISPAGGFCEENRDSVCLSDSDCTTTCNVGTPIGSVDGFITIFGQNFGAYDKDVSRVIFRGSDGNTATGVMPSVINTACVDTWRDDQIVIAVPEGVSIGPIGVINKDNLSDQTNDDSGPAIPDFLPSNLGRPGLCYLSPDRGGLSSEVAYQGVNLFSGQAYFGNYQNHVRALSSQFNQAAGLVGTALTPNIQSGPSGSFVEKTSATGNVRSNFLRFIKDPEEGDGPFISSFTPTSGPSGQYVTIRGRGFGGARGLSKVYFGDKEASYDFPDMCLSSVWRDTQIVVKVPPTLADGPLAIKIVIGSTTLDTKRLNPGAFLVNQAESLRTSLCKIEPDRGPVATPVTIWGEYFGVTGNNGLVKFNFDKTATGTISKDGRADKINTTVPSGSITGPVRVVNNSQWGNELNFSVGECVIDSDCGTQVCCPANTYKAGSCSQTLAACFIEIPNSVFEWRFSTGFSDGSTTTPPCIGPFCNPDDPCQKMTGFDACSRDTKCCFDAKHSLCRSGEQIPSGNDLGYCAYYNCNNEGGGSGVSCASDTPVRNGSYPDVSSCQYYCANPPAGVGLSCAGYATSTCASSICNYPGAACLLESGLSGQQPPACGSCCCQPGTVNPLNPELDCIADQGACTGAGRGLYCGCTRDEQCGATATVGCGSGACCEARPDVLGTSPKHLADQVCRNVAIRVDFNQPLNQGTLANGVLLLEEREYGDGVCPNGTFIAAASSVEELFADRDSRLVAWVKNLGKTLQVAWRKAQGDFSPETALAELPDQNKLYCAFPGQVSGQNSGERGSLIFRPAGILSPSTNYYFIIKGDEELNSQTGILSINEIGLNGRGYYDDPRGTGSGNYVEGENIPFNGRVYKNSHIIKFSTLSANNPTVGICAIDRVEVEPSSYLFSTTQNNLEENDTNFKHPSFDTASDRDKLVNAYAYSSDDQILQPVTGYFWDWEFKLSNPSVVSLSTGSAITNLPPFSAFITAKEGVTDAETKIEARIKMNRFASPSCTANRCSCTDLSCSNNCCNAFLGGNDFNNNSSLYVFICNNPWPPVASTGLWSPWVDNCEGVVGGNCTLYNYKFYYCRDAGEAGTLDDLPAIINQAVIRGESTNLVCSIDGRPCAPGSISNTTKCGEDKNGDGQADGLCVWNVLKESYFFRSAVPVSGEIVSVTDMLSGGKVKINWRSDTMMKNGVSHIYSYKIYYFPAGQGAMLSKEIKLAEPTNTQSACVVTNGKYDCQDTIDGLSNNTPYIFKLSIVSVDRSESKLSPEKSATPTDQIAPATPMRLEIRVVDNSILKFTWNSNSNDAAKHRVYRGTASGQYGESFDSQLGAFSLSLPLDRINGENNYFTVTAIDSSGNESEQHPEISCIGAGSAMNCGGGGGGVQNN